MLDDMLCVCVCVCVGLTQQQSSKGLRQPLGLRVASGAFVFFSFFLFLFLLSFLQFSCCQVGDHEAGLNGLNEEEVMAFRGTP